MAFQVPESKRSIKQNRFEFEIDGKTFSMPKAKYLTTGQIELMSTKGQELTIVDLLDLFGRDDDVAAAVRTLDSEQLQALMEAWQEDSGLTVGESQASS